jgi:hypothetical protein
MLQIRAIVQDDEEQDLSDSKGILLARKTRTRALTLNSVATGTKHACHLTFQIRGFDLVCERTGVSFDASWSGELYKILPYSNRTKAANLSCEEIRHHTALLC